MAELKSERIYQDTSLKSESPSGELDPTSFKEKVKESISKNPYVGLGEYAAAGASGLAAAIPGGLRMLPGLLPGRSFDKDVDAGKQLSQDLTYEPRGKAGKLITDAAHKVLDVGRDLSGRGVEVVAGGSSPGQQAIARSIGEIGFDIGQMFIPLGAGAKSIRAKQARDGAIRTKEQGLKGNFEDGTPSKAPDYNTSKYNPQELDIGFKPPEGFDTDARPLLPEGLVARRDRALDPQYDGSPPVARLSAEDSIAVLKSMPDEARPRQGGEIPFEARGSQADRPMGDLIRERRAANAEASIRAFEQKQANADALPWTGPGNRQRGGLGFSKNPRESIEAQLKEIEKQKDREKKNLEDYRLILDTYLNDPHQMTGNGKYTNIDGTRITIKDIQNRIKEYRELIKNAEASLKKFEGDEASLRQTLKNPKASVHTLPVRGGQPGGKQSGMIGFGKTAERKGIVQAIKDFSYTWREDLRPLKEAIAENHPNLKPEEVRDVVPEGAGVKSGIRGLAAKGMGNFLIDKQMALWSQGKGPISTVIKWVVDNQTAINRNLKQRIEANTNTWAKPWRQLRNKSFGEIREMLTIWQENIGKKALTESDFKTTRQWEVFQKVQETLADLRNRTNDMRRKIDPSGKVHKLMAHTENYFPGMRSGDWWVNVHDKTGKLIASESFPTVIQANLARKRIAKDMGGEFDISPVKKKIATEHDLNSLDAYRETIQAGDAGDPVIKAVQARLNFLLGTRGFGKHSLHRKGVEGALGFEGGVLGVRRAEKVLEAYITRGETYLANLERSQIERQVSELSEHKYWKDEEGRVHSEATLYKGAPVAKQWIDEYLARSRGKDLDMLPGIRQLADSFIGLAGSRGMATRALQNLSSLASLFYLVTPRNALVQLTQPLNAMAKFVEIHQMQGYGPLSAAIKAPFTLFNGMVRALPGSKDVLSSEVKQWAIKTGRLESAIVGLIEGKMSNWKGEGSRLIGELARLGLGKIEQHFVRTPVLLGFEHALRETYPNKMERFEVAANLTDNYMVHYDRESSPMMYDKSGSILGESVRGLKTYSHNTWGQFFEYAKTIKDKGQLAPLATFISTQFAVGGARGIFLVAEASAAITLINWMFNEDFDTPERWLLKEGVSDMVLFGGLSTLAGRDVSSSVAAPNMPQMFNFVPIEFTAKIIKDVWNYLHKKASGIATDQDTMKAMLAVSPNAMQGWVTALFSEDTGLIPNANDKMKGSYPAPEAGSGEWMMRFGLNLRSLDEAKQAMINRNVKQMLQIDIHQKLDILDAIVDQATNDKEIPDKLLEKYVKEGGNLTRLPQNIRERLQDRELTYEERLAKGKKITPDKMHKLDIMKQLMDEELGKRIEQKRSKGGFEKSGFTEDFEKEFNALKQQGNRQAVQEEAGFGPPPDRQDKRDRIIKRLPDGRPEGFRDIPVSTGTRSKQVNM